MAIGILIIGDEILSGKRADGHFAAAVRILGERGLELGWAQLLGDDRDRITAALARSFASTDIVFSFGGIGATPDDHTRQAAAAALGRALVRHPGAVAEIEARFGAAAWPRRVIMADFPEGAVPIPNPVNRVPGFSVNDHHFLPGFPEMAWPMMAAVLDARYASLRRAAPACEAALVVSGAGESDLLPLMQAVVRDYPDLKLASLPRFAADVPEIELAVRGDAARADAAREFLRAEIAKLGYDVRDAPAPRHAVPDADPAHGPARAPSR